MSKLIAPMILLLANTSVLCQEHVSSSFRDYYNRANTLYDSRDFNGALSEYNHAIELKPDFALAYNGRGRAWLSLGNLGQAVADYSTAISLDPDYALAYFNRGCARRTQENVKGAIADFNKAIDVDPHFALAFAYRGFAQMSLGRERDARKDFARSLKLDGSVKTLLEQYGKTQVKMESTR